MAHTYSCLHYHYIFSTHQRAPLLTAEIRERLWPYMGGIARNHGMVALAVGGTENHCHALVRIPPTVSPSKAIQTLKGESSAWLTETFPEGKNIRWQEAYGVFTVSMSHLPATVQYIEHQVEHHRKKTFEEEYLAFLAKHNVEFDERYIWT